MTGESLLHRSSSQKTWNSRCSACGHHSLLGKHYWHLMRCEPWLLLHHPLRDADGEVIEPRTIDHPIGLAL